MGKLHKLRRAILRNPDEWIYTSYFGAHDAMPAYITPFNGARPMGWWWSHSYKQFVRKVLRDIGKLSG